MLRTLTAMTFMDFAQSSMANTNLNSHAIWPFRSDLYWNPDILSMIFLNSYAYTVRDLWDRWKFDPIKLDSIPKLDLAGQVAGANVVGILHILLNEPKSSPEGVSPFSDLPKNFGHSTGTYPGKTTFVRVVHSLKLYKLFNFFDEIPSLGS